MALCEDGSLWQLVYGTSKWNRLVTIPEKPTQLKELRKILPDRLVDRIQEYGINSIHELTSLTREEMLSIPGVGSKTFFEMEMRLNEVDIFFKEY